MMSDLRAELTKQVRRPAHWLLLAVAVVLTVTFAYVIPYAGYTGSASGAPTNGRGLPSMLPAEIVGNVVAGTPVFVGALAVIFGVLAVGNEYGWETWKTVLAQNPSRLRAYAAKLSVVTLGSLLLIVGMLATAAVAATVIAVLEDQPLTWPSPSALVVGVGAGWLVCTMWAALGLLLGIAFRSVAMPIGLGLVWILAVQNLLTTIAAPLLGWVDKAQQALPGPNVGSLVADLGAPEAPGVEALVGSGQAAAVIAAYLAAFAVAGAMLLYRRDIE